MTIDLRLLPQYLPEDPYARLNVYSVETGRAVLHVCPREVMDLARASVIDGVLSKHGYLRYLRLIAPIHRAHAVLRRTMPAGMGRGITHNRTAAGAKCWKQRPDRAKCGAGGQAAIWTNPGERHGGPKRQIGKLGISAARSGPVRWLIKNGMDITVRNLRQAD